MHCFTTSSQLDLLTSRADHNSMVSRFAMFCACDRADGSTIVDVHGQALTYIYRVSKGTQLLSSSMWIVLWLYLETTRYSCGLARLISWPIYQEKYLQEADWLACTVSRPVLILPTRSCKQQSKWPHFESRGRISINSRRYNFKCPCSIERCESQAPFFKQVKTRYNFGASLIWQTSW